MDCEAAQGTVFVLTLFNNCKTAIVNAACAKIAPSEKLPWPREQKAAGKLDGDHPEEIAQAEALLTMLVRLGGSRTTSQSDKLVETKSAKPVRARRYG